MSCSLLSWTFAPETTKAKGTPFWSTTICRLLPNFPRSVGFFPIFFPFLGSRDRMAIQNLPPPRDPLQILILAQAVCPHFSEYPLSSPLLEIPMSRASRVIFSGKHLPLTTCTQDIENPIQDLAWFRGRPSSWPSLRFWLRDEILDFFPELITDVSPTWSPRKRLTILLSSHSGSPPTKGTLARNLQKF